MISPNSRWLAAAVPFVLAACAVNQPPKAPGELGREFKATIPGAWSGTVDGDSLSCQMIKQFNADGTAHGVILAKRRARGFNMVMPEVPFQSRWRVVGDTVETYAIKTEVPGLFKKGEVIKDTILSVSQNRIVSRSADGKIEVIERLRSSR